MKVSLYERIVLLNVIPKEPKNYTEAKRTKTLLRKLELSKKEKEKYNLTESTTISELDSPEFERDFDQAELDLIEQTLLDIEKSGKFSLRLVGLYERFVIHHGRDAISAKSGKSS